MGDISTEPRFVPTRGAPPPATDDELRVVAIKRVKAKRDFRNHLFVYLVVNIGLWTLWIVSGFTDGWVFAWPILPTVFWGLFVLRHAYVTYRRVPLREDLVQTEIEQLRAAAEVHPLDTYDLDD